MMTRMPGSGYLHRLRAGTPSPRFGPPACLQVQLEVAAGLPDPTRSPSRTASPSPTPSSPTRSNRQPASVEDALFHAPFGIEPSTYESSPFRQVDSEVNLNFKFNFNLKLEFELLPLAVKLASHSLSAAGSGFPTRSLEVILRVTNFRVKLKLLVVRALRLQWLCQLTRSGDLKPATQAGVMMLELALAVRVTMTRSFKFAGTVEPPS